MAGVPAPEQGSWAPLCSLLPDVVDGEQRLPAWLCEDGGREPRPPRWQSGEAQENPHAGPIASCRGHFSVRRETILGAEHNLKSSPPPAPPEVRGAGTSWGEAVRGNGPLPNLSVKETPRSTALS